MKTIVRTSWWLLWAVFVTLALILGFNLIGSSPLQAAVPSQDVKAGIAASSTPTLDVTTAVNALESQIITVHDAASPSVVNIVNRSYAVAMGQRFPQGGSGSGFVYDSQGHIITNYHVVENAEELLVTLYEGSQYGAELVGSDPVNDLAVIRIDAGKDLPPALTLGDSSQVRVGQFVLAIGNPFGLGQTLTTGVVSALGRIIESPQDYRFISEVIQTDAAINPGNSGGPLLDLRGRVIGVNSQIISPSGASSGIGFAVSANTVRRVVPSLIEQGEYPHPWLGAQLYELTPAAAEMLREAGMKLPEDQGLLIVETVRNAPAATAGLRGSSQTTRIGNVQLPMGGDVIVGIDDVEIRTFQDLTVYLETETQVGDKVTLQVLRDGKLQRVTLQLGRQP